MPKKDDGLGLPSVVLTYKSLQVSRQAQLLTSADSTVRRIAEKNLQDEVAVRRKKFCPAVIVHDTLKQDHGMSRRTLKMVARRQVAENEHQAR